MITHLVTAFYMLQLVSGSSTGWTGTAAEKLLFGGAQLNKGSSTLDFVITGADAKVTTALDYHPTSHASLGALIEPQRTNYLLNSGTPATQSVSLGAGTYTLWIAGSGSCVLSGGPTGTATAGSPATFTLGSTTSVTFTISGTVTRFQVELGLEPTSFIPTTSAQVTRAADLPQLSISSIPTVNNVSWSAYVNAVLIGKGGTAGQAPLSIGTADGSDDAAITWAGVSTPLTQYSSGGVNSAIGAPTVGTEFNAAARWVTNDFNNAMNGKLGAADTSGSLTTGSTLLSFGTETVGGTAYVGHAYIKKILVVPQALTNTELQIITGGTSAVQRQASGAVAVSLIGSAVALARKPGVAAASVSLVGAAAASVMNTRTLTLLAAMTTQPDATRQGHINTLITSLSSIWTKLDVLYVLAAHDNQAARLNWKNPGTLTAALVSTPTFTTDRGYAGNGTSTALNTGYNPSTFSGTQFLQNTNHMSVWSGTDVSASAQTDCGHTNARIISKSANNTAAAVDNAAATATFSISGQNSSIGWTCIARQVSTQYEAVRNLATPINVTQTSAAVVSLPFYLCANAATGPVGANWSTRRIQAFSAGAYLSDAERDTVYSALATYMTAVGA